MLLRAFVDETGDRGMRATSSPYFAFAALLVRDDNMLQLHAGLDGLVESLRKPPGHVLHWAQNIKDHADRRLAAQTLGALPVRLQYVVVPKTSVRPGSLLAKSTEGYYNYAARLLLERIGLFTRRIERNAGGGVEARCKVTFGQVKGFNPTVLRDYVDKVRRTSNDACWKYLTPTINVDGQKGTRALQWADIGAGALDSAIKGNRHGMYETSYLAEIAKLIDRSPSQAVLDYGLKILGDNRMVTDLPWWPAYGLS